MDWQDFPKLYFSDTQKFVEYGEDLPVTSDGCVGPETIQHSPEVSSNLTSLQKRDLQCVLSEYRDVLSEVPGCTPSIKHDIELCSTDRIRAKFYPVPLHLKPLFD